MDVARGGHLEGVRPRIRKGLKDLRGADRGGPLEVLKWATWVVHLRKCSWRRPFGNATVGKKSRMQVELDGLRECSFVCLAIWKC